jgi:ribose 5-phosphate isomerase B
VNIALGSDMRSELTRELERLLLERGHEVELIGALAPGMDDAWTTVGREVGEAVAGGRCRFGIVCCWTGTGVSIAANKVRGVRAALCGDAATAEGARVWNDANVLALSLRVTTPAVAQEILEAWFGGVPTTEAPYALMIRAIQE